MAAVRFSKPEVVLSQPWTKISHRNVVASTLPMAAILKNRYDVITLPPIVRFRQNWKDRCKMTWRWL